jgi:hypothetical protein
MRVLAFHSMHEPDKLPSKRVYHDEYPLMPPKISGEFS